ncbi:YdeI/OmpD-associated family protein [Vulcaniibacterium thermophilum]|nr:YdeI/OmpD-associated family protein [Vulcaniibacterium thermophilum]
MTPSDPRIDAYIEQAAAFAQPILRHLRAVVHEACPDVEEAIKWGAPAFLFRGKLMCSMAAFKRHAAFGFWNRDVAGSRASDDAMGQFGRLTRVGDLPTKRELARRIREAMAAIEQGAPRARTPRPRTPLPVPDDFAAALDANPAARTAFETFAPSHRREYLEWILEAKRADTRARRIAQAIGQLAQGKSRHWKYERR